MRYLQLEVGQHEIIGCLNEYGRSFRAKFIKKVVEH